MPLEGTRLVIEPKFPNAAALAEIGAPKPEPIPEGYKHRNTFWSWRWRSEIDIWEVNGKLKWGLHPKVHHATMELDTLRVADAWSLESEQKALAMLFDLAGPRRFKHYLLTGSFIESSKRSGVFYVFRRLRPTLALKECKGEMKILCALCLHPIAYYQGTWGGGMCPTDDVIGHLMLMRGDEPMLWRRANQHPSFRPEAGI